MKNKAFTLIELLAVIIVLGILLGILVPSVIKTIGESKQKAYNTTVESIKTAAESYINMDADPTVKQELANTGTSVITLDELIDAGFLPNEVIDPFTNEPLTGTVTITKISENKYTYDFIE